MEEPSERKIIEMEELIMGVYDELKARGLIAQLTNEEKVRDLLNNGKTSFYIGFDPTADSLHVGHFVQIMVMAHMQKAGHTDRFVWRRNRYDRRPFGKNRYEKNDDSGGN